MTHWPRWLYLGTILLVVIVVAQGHENERFAPGVPRAGMAPGAHQAGGNIPNNQNPDVKFHEPGDFQAPPQPSGDQPGQQPPQGSQGQKHPEPPRGRAPPPEARHHFAGGRKAGLDIQHEKEHMKEHLEDEYISLDSLDEPQLLAQYFRNFDLDKNGRVDGLELLKALHRMNVEHGHESEDSNYAIDDDLVEEMDDELKFYDDNNDGYISYAEFMRNHKKRLGSSH